MEEQMETQSKAKVEINIRDMTLEISVKSDEKLTLLEGFSRAKLLFLMYIAHEALEAAANEHLKKTGSPDMPLGYWLDQVRPHVMPSDRD